MRVKMSKQPPSAPTASVVGPALLDIHYSYKRDSEESHDDFFKSVSHNICIANFRPMIIINYIH